MTTLPLLQAMPLRAQGASSSSRPAGFRAPFECAAPAPRVSKRGVAARAADDDTRLVRKTPPIPFPGRSCESDPPHGFSTPRGGYTPRDLPEFRPRMPGIALPVPRVPDPGFATTSPLRLPSAAPPPAHPVARRVGRASAKATRREAPQNPPRARGRRARDPEAPEPRNAARRVALLPPPQSPSTPKSPLGEMLAYYLDQQPHLFHDAVEQQLERIKAEKDNELHRQGAPGADALALSLSRRVGEVRAAERRLSVEDVMYLCIVEKFASAGVDMLPPIDGLVDLPPGDFKYLTEGVHSEEALALVKEHILAVMGPASQALGSTPIKAGKLQAAQIYAASVMFGYFLRRVDRRFQLDRALGTLGEGGVAEAAARLNELFEMSDGDGADPDAAPDAPGPAAGAGKDGRATLKGYVESFDQQALQETARLVSVEGAALVERQTTGLFGKVADLQREMQEAVGEMNEIADVNELMERLQSAVRDDRVRTVTMTAATQRRMVLEAVAYGSFLRDVETRVDEDYALLTALPPGGGPGLLGPGGGGGPLEPLA